MFSLYKLKPVWTKPPNKTLALNIDSINVVFVLIFLTVSQSCYNSVTRTSLDFFVSFPRISFTDSQGKNQSESRNWEKEAFSDCTLDRGFVNSEFIE